MLQNNTIINIPSPRSSKGFTLVELSVVITIIALIIGGVIGGVALKRNLEIKSVMDTMASFTQAVNDFKKTYNALPGDYWNAVNSFGSTTSNGNGDGTLSTGTTSTEQAVALQHLALAGLIKGNFNGTWTKSGMYFGPISNSAFWLSGISGQTEGVAIYIGGIVDTSSGAGTTYTIGKGIFTPSEMLKIDQKYDDGVPNTGTIIASDGNGSTAGSCVNTGTTPQSYNVSNTGKNCIFYIIMNRRL